MSEYTYVQSKAKPSRNYEGIEIAPPTRLDHQFMVANKLPILVLNNTRPMGAITLTMKLSTGASIPLRIPRDKAPFNVTDEIPHSDISRGGRDLWLSLQKKVLTLVWPSDAQDLFGGRVSNGVDVTQTSVWANGGKETEAVKDTILAQNTAAQDPNGGVEEAVSVHPKVMDITARAVSGELKAEAAIREYDLVSEEVSDRDLSYAIAEVKAGKLREWLQAKLAEISAKGQKSVATVGANPSTLPNKTWDDDDSDMTPEEKAAEAIRAQKAATRQKIR